MKIMKEEVREGMGLRLDMCVCERERVAEQELKKRGG